MILLSILIFFIIIFCIAKLIYDNLPDSNNTNPPNNYISKTHITENIDYNLYYKPKRYITTLTELKFYNVLLEIAKELDLVLFSQVSLYNIIQVKETNYKNTAFNKIRSKCIDFVLVDKTNCRIKLCIELDDYTHNRNSRKERDKFLDNLFKSLEIDFIRFKVFNYYNKELLKQTIKESIKEHYYV